MQQVKLEGGTGRSGFHIPAEGSHLVWKLETKQSEVIEYILNSGSGGTKLDTCILAAV